MTPPIWPPLSKEKCQVCNRSPKVLGVNSRPGKTIAMNVSGTAPAIISGRLVICEECDRKNNSYYYKDLPPPIEEIYEEQNETTPRSDSTAYLGL